MNVDALQQAAEILAAEGQQTASAVYARAAHDHECHPEVCTGKCGYEVEAQRILTGAK